MVERYVDKFFESLHKTEFERKDKHEANDGFLLAALSVLGSVGVYFLRILPPDDNLASITFDALSIIYLGLIGHASVCVGMSAWPRDIFYLSDPGELRNFAEGLRAHFGFAYNESDEAKLADAIDAEMLTLARSQHAECAEKNRKTNQRKLAWQSRARRSVSLSIIVLVANSIPTFIVQRSRSDIQAVEIKKWPSPEEASNQIGDPTSGRSTETDSTEPTEASAESGKAGISSSKADAAPNSSAP